jgi:hypothetical protein
MPPVLCNSQRHNMETGFYIHFFGLENRRYQLDVDGHLK